MLPEADVIKQIAQDAYIKPGIGDWGIQKYNRLNYYASIFTTAMHNKWQYRVYIDLFAGAGAAITRTQKKLVLTSPIIALNQRHPFTHYIFCELDTNKLEALSYRVQKLFPNAHVNYFPGDVNKNINDVIKTLKKTLLPSHTLILCFVDPFAIGNLHFNTIKRLSNFRTDFLFLIPTYYDVKRNFMLYLDPNNHKLDNFLGGPQWRSEWHRYEKRNIPPGIFLLKYHSKIMKDLGYHSPRLTDYKKVIISQKSNVPLYHLVLYSKNKKGIEFWRKTLNGTQNQYSIFDILDKE